MSVFLLYLDDYIYLALIPIHMEAHTYVCMPVSVLQVKRTLTATDMGTDTLRFEVVYSSAN